ncbi:MAG: transcriptional repressor [Bacteroidaceae bacterium]|nr:transcriptional repressor [Bacteroidaceae bacterium]
MSEKANIQETVAEQFRTFLIAHQLRQTKERYAILRAIYDLEGTFTIEELQQTMQERRFPVSTGTLYQTAQLLVQANLLIQHPFSSSSAVFERIDDDRPRSYQICAGCHRITRIKSKELAASLDTYRPRTFTVSHRIVYVYGTCATCMRQMRRQLRLYQQNASHNKKQNKS